ncbi:MAG: helix-turn-helix transcriptional regulator [Oscillospiraceae bacterium]|nr:helix-turn-helix transcriptional regulator [Oscillospiraceae bacterium]
MFENEVKKGTENYKFAAEENREKKPDNELYTFCKNIKYIRKKEKLSLSKMAHIMHISTNTLKKIENGEFPKRLGSSVLMNIYRYFGIMPSQQMIPISEDDE